MTSWAVVCDVWYMEPQILQPSETPIEFSERSLFLTSYILLEEHVVRLDMIYMFVFGLISRVRDMIAKRAGIKKVPWDGYLKYYRPSPKLTEKQ